jgi:acetyl-CoA synthetase
MAAGIGTRIGKPVQGNQEQDALPADGTQDHYHELYQQFRWHVPTHFNIAEVCCTRWSGDKNRIAVYYEDEEGHTATLTYMALQAQANRMSNVLRDLGVRRGEIVAIVLPQRAETAIAVMACFQLGAIAMPMSVLFGPEALEYRLQNSGAVVAIADQAAIKSLTEVRPRCHALEHIIAVDCDGPVTLDWYAELAHASPSFHAVRTEALEPAILIYTSGTTGAPKGALLPHAAIIGNLSGFVASQNWFPKEGDVFWSPADWAWTGGLMDALLPTLYFGKPIVGYRGRFSAEAAFRLLEKYGITNTFLFPTALKLMMKAVPSPHDHYKLKLRAIMSAGEAVGDAVFTWGATALGVTINEMFGQTEMNYIVGNSAHQWPAKAGSMGRPYPGHRVCVIDEAGNPVAAGEVGDVALHRTDIHGFPDPIFFLGYWKNPEATHSKFTGDWCRTGDLASMDEDGHLWYQGRSDDMFKSSGYRIGPSEIENCLVKHKAVANAAVVPKPDAERGALVKAFIVLAANVKRSRAADDKLIAELQAHVRGQLAHYEYPKEIEFIEELPMTTTGKLQRRVLRLLEEERARDSALLKNP